MGKRPGIATALDAEWQVQRRLDDAHWIRIVDALPARLAASALDNENTRQFVEAVLWKAHAHAYWSDIPVEFPKWHSIYLRFGCWADEGVWRFVLEALDDLPATKALLQQMVNTHVMVKRGHKAGSYSGGSG